MKSASHNTICTYIIYALKVTDESDDIVFIGKTRSPDLRRPWRHHFGGYCKLTADDFSKNTCQSPPTIHILSVLENVTISLAFKYQLAWYRHADESGYITIARDTFDKAAYRMLPETQAIYDRISRIPFETYLAQPYDPSVLPPAHHSKPQAPAKETQKTVQLNIRIGTDEHKHFCDICNDNSLTQREAFAVLLSKSSEAAASQLIKRQRLTIEEHLRTIDSLRCNIKKTSRGANADVRLKNALSFCKEAIQQYISLISHETKNPSQPIKCKSWSQFTKTFPNYHTYSYPGEDGFSVIVLDTLCYGHGKYSAIFIWGTDVDNGNKIKVRYYPKQDYMGIPFPHSPFVCKSLPLLIGYRSAPDKAADLYFAIPLVPQSLKIWSQATGVTQGKKLSLDERIHRIQIPQKCNSDSF